MPHFDDLLSRIAAAAALTERGYPTKPSTLATKATRGGGPPYRKFGNSVRYHWGTTLKWAEQKAGPALCTTSEHRVASNASQSPAQNAA
jgi:hypothetical protein